MSNHGDGLAASRYYTGHNAGGGQRPDAYLRFSGAPHAGERQGPRAALIAAMGLAYDPLASGVSERDLAPDFGSIYVDALPGLLARLRRPEAACLFADYGMGKTATRLALEYALRLARTPAALSVTYAPSLEALARADGDLLHAHLNAIADELRLDLMVQYIERLPERHAEREAPPGPLAAQAIARQAPMLPGRFVSAMRASRRAEPPEGAFWRWFRPVVRHVAATPAWCVLVDQLVRAARPAGARASWEETVFDARSLGFGPIFVLVDAVDNGRFGAGAYLEVVRPLLAAAAELERHGIYLKLFLPRELRPALEEAAPMGHGLTLPPAIATIDKISAIDLDKILTDRFEAARASGASLAGLDWLGQELGESVQARLVEAARGSPRLLIELASALVDFHSLNGFRREERLWLTPDEWRRFLGEIVPAISAPG